MGKTFYDILGVSKDAPPAAVIEAFRKLVREGHPDRFKDAQEKAQAEHLLKDITEAFNNLSNPARRAEYDKTLAQPSGTAVKTPQEQVKEYLAQGIARYRQGDMNGALGMLDHVLRLQPENAQALFHAGMIRLHNPKWRAQGTEAVENAIRLEPYNGQWALEYGEFLLANGQSIRAAKILEVAAEANPASEEIRALLAKSQGSDPEKPGGFSLFGRKP